MSSLEIAQILKELIERVRRETRLHLWCTRCVAFGETTQEGVWKLAPYLSHMKTVALLSRRRRACC